MGQVPAPSVTPAGTARPFSNCCHTGQGQKKTKSSKKTKRKMTKIATSFTHGILESHSHGAIGLPSGGMHMRSCGLLYLTVAYGSVRIYLQPFFLSHTSVPRSRSLTSQFRRSPSAAHHPHHPHHPQLWRGKLLWSPIRDPGGSGGTGGSDSSGGGIVGPKPEPHRPLSFKKCPSHLVQGHILQASP